MRPPAPRLPCVWVVASHRELANEHGQPQCYTVMDEAGTRTLVNMGLQPVCYPRVPPEHIGATLETVDGILLGGSATNVHPRLYGEAPASPDFLFDECRDAVAQPLIRLAVARRVPVIAFCRGSHDFNVAMGGSLHQSLQALPGSVAHREDPDEPLDEQYRERHEVACVPGGELERMAGMPRFAVSSLHSQGVKRLGRGVVAEAHADDGLVEAFRWHEPGVFAWGFQFHPEWGWRRHPAYGRIMASYVNACYAHQTRRREQGGDGPRPERQCGPVRIAERSAPTTRAGRPGFAQSQEKCIGPRHLPWIKRTALEGVRPAHLQRHFPHRINNEMR